MKKPLTILLMSLCITSVHTLFAALPACVEPVRLILDAAGACGRDDTLAVLHALADVGEAEVLAVSLSSAN